VNHEAGYNNAAAESDVCPLCGAIDPAARAGKPPPPHAEAEGWRTPRHHPSGIRSARARFSEAEIARRLSGIESLRRDPRLAQFIAWVQH
jgi:hypothetical protein